LEENILFAGPGMEMLYTRELIRGKVFRDHQSGRSGLGPLNSRAGFCSLPATYPRHSVSGSDLEGIPSTESSGHCSDRSSSLVVVVAAFSCRLWPIRLCGNALRMREPPNVPPFSMDNELRVDSVAMAHSSAGYETRSNQESKVSLTYPAMNSAS
jgi:hypothetical protein